MDENPCRRRDAERAANHQDRRNQKRACGNVAAGPSSSFGAATGYLPSGLSVLRANNRARWWGRSQLMHRESNHPLSLQKSVGGGPPQSCQSNWTAEEGKRQRQLRNGRLGYGFKVRAKKMR